MILAAWDPLGLGNSGPGLFDLRRTHCGCLSAPGMVISPGEAATAKSSILRNPACWKECSGDAPLISSSSKFRLCSPCSRLRVAPDTEKRANALIGQGSGKKNNPRHEGTLPPFSPTSHRARRGRADARPRNNLSKNNPPCCLTTLAAELASDFD
ncbi:unnamed protein product [Pleuronectes platessa]|uniref:Uncharacterized protein n=1 Tax=Pleuronectes platessa TaxID=8262 RepID=A0A9N7UH22_PLEPL|nr:unnamed protein product [Pleuronectes platessa]